MAATLALGIGAAVSFEKVNKNVNSAEAAGTTRTFFLDCSSCGDWDSQSICIGTWNGSVNTYTEATKKDDNYWQVTIDVTGLVGVEFYRCAEGKTGTRWNKSQWNTNVSSNMLCKVTGWGATDNDPCPGSWEALNSSVDETYQLASTTPSSTTKRIWVDPQSQFYSAGARAALRVFNGTTHVITYILGGSSQYATVGSEAYIFYVDINVNYDCQLVRLHNVFNYVWSYGKNICTDMDGYNTTKIVYQWSASPDVDYSCGNESDPNVDYAKKVLDGYSTCVDSDVNGYGAYSELNTNILSKLDASELSQLRSATFSDPTYGTRTYGDKIDLMANPRSSGRTIVPNGLDNNSNAIVGIIASLTIVASLGGYFLLKKKRI